MGLFPKTAKSRAHDLIQAIWDARAHAPIAEIEELIPLARKKPSIRKEVLDSLEAPIADDGNDITMAWFGLTCGEIGREGLLMCLDGIGRSEDGLGDSVLVQVLERHVLEVFPEILRRLHQLEQLRGRAELYEVLQAAIIVGDAAVKARLRNFALERWEVEKTDPEALKVLDQPLLLLHCLGEDVGDRIKDARRLSHGHKDALSYIDDFDDEVRQGLDLLQTTRVVLAADWKATAQMVEKAIGSGPQTEG